MLDRFCHINSWRYLGGIINNVMCGQCWQISNFYFFVPLFQVVTEPTPFPGGPVGINSFGFGGSNSHLLLAPNPKEKVNKGIPSDKLPRLVILSGRTYDAVETFLEKVSASKSCKSENKYIIQCS